ncbi:Ornithine decarboxylase [Recurvomyces mirabilis]|uniref:Ornithine decarboxylase n=1 Tax=Recurvomyces mirabilis TaxID=574656 RepID=A0AAE0WTI1_9PEZI|nr:Ornithine decarboxylase [Recurvomyces mirabilis]KAK5157307.1 Ornithine decarboxylase [Recurvomyces mirabilis]
MAPSAVDAFNNDHQYGPVKIEQEINCISDHDFGRNDYVPNNAAKIAKEMIGAALQKHIKSVNPSECEAGEEDAFFVADIGEVYRQHMRWKKNLPRVTPHYAIKCNPDPVVLQLLATLGAGFDCASKAEIEQVLKIGVDPSRIIYAQPCKTKSYLRYTAKQNVRQMTFDNTDELYKVKELCPEAELYLRILTDDSASLCRLSNKFGASMENTQELLELAKELDLNIAGVAFHVGSGATDTAAFVKAVTDARDVFDRAKALGFAPHTLDVGGGFVSETFEETADVLNMALEAHMPSSIRIIAEPGRYYTSSAFTLACNVIARRTVEDRETGEKSYMLYLNDGVYGNFSSIIFDHQHPIPQILSTSRKQNNYNYDLSSSTESLTDSGYTSASEDTNSTDPSIGGKAITYSIWGPTCDGIDCISEQWKSAQTVDVGDWLYFEDMGAYTKCSATKFNGFTDKHETIYVSSEAGASAVLGF